LNSTLIPHSDAVHRFLFEELDIRGALVQLGPAWTQMQARRNYAAPVRDLLGQLAAVTTLIGSNLKTPGRLSFQIQGHGPVGMLVTDCDEQLRIRGLARADTKELTAVPPAPTFEVCDLIGDGQLILTLQTAKGSPYQSVVPLEGDTLAAIFEHYLAQSEQQPARLLLMANETHACGLFLQKLPGADLRDPDGWNRIEALASTVHDSELALPPDELITRLFSAELVRLFDPRAVSWHCPRDEEKVRTMLLSLGREEVESMLADAEEIAVEDEICGHEYRFGAEILDELFPPAGRILH
jgi:molecular chaperone Hsp33